MDCGLYTSVTCVCQDSLSRTSIAISRILLSCSRNTINFRYLERQNGSVNLELHQKGCRPIAMRVFFTLIFFYASAFLAFFGLDHLKCDCLIIFLQEEKTLGSSAYVSHPIM